MFIIAQLEPRFMARWVPIGYLIGVMLLVEVDVMGHNALGATRWINIPGVIRFQPSEFMKILMPATIAWYLSKRTLPPQLKHVAVSLMLIGAAETPEQQELACNLPTSGVTVIDFAFDDWGDITLRAGTLERFVSPRKLRVARGA